MAPTGWFALLLLWILFFWLYRDYRLDYFRQQLFGLRDELFDLASSGELKFDSKAYGMLRSTINGTIQYGHQLGFLHVVCFLVFARRDPLADEVVAKFDQRWSEAIDSTAPEIQVKLKSIRNRLHLFVAQQVVFTSFFLVATLVTVVAGVLLVILKKVVLRQIERLFSTDRFRHLLSTLDCSAAIHAS